MKTVIFILLLTPLISYAQHWQWVQKAGGNSEANGRAICTDGSGNVYIAADSSGRSTVYKYSSAGGFNWNKSYLSNSARAIVSDNAGFLYIAGDSANHRIVTKINTDGVLVRQISYGTGFLKGISLSESGHIYLTGTGVLLQKSDTADNLKWSEAATGAIGNSITTDSDENAYITGTFSGNAIFGSFNLTALGSQDIFIAKYDSAGNCLWAKRAGGGRESGYSNDSGKAIAIDQSGNIYITGSITDTADFDGFTLIGKHNDLFLAKYNFDGDLVWVTQATGWADEEGRCLAIDPSGNIIVGGSFVPDMFFGNYPLNGWGNYDAFISTFDSDGIFIKAISAGGPEWNEYVYGITIDNTGNTFVTGSFHKTSYFGMDTLISDKTGGANIFIGKIDLATGINEIAESFNFNIYPNPSKGFFTIEIDNSVDVKEIQITDIFGKVILQQKLMKQSKLEVENIPGGTYIITIISNDNNKVSRKIISIN